MDLDPKRTERRDKFIITMAQKLAKGNGVEMIGAAKRRKKRKKLTYVIGGTVAFIISGLIIYFHMPKQIKFDPESYKQNQLHRNPVNRLSADYQDEKISTDQYALYLKDILIDYKSLPQEYKIDIPYIEASAVYDSIITVWSSISLPNRLKLQKYLPDLEHLLKENQNKNVD